MPKKVFILNALEDNKYLQALEKQLVILKNQDIIQSWDRSKVVAGGNWRKSTEKNLRDADITLLLISADFLSQKWCGEMQKKALELGKYLIPVILRPCLWRVDKDLNALSARPKQSEKVVPISSWNNQDEAFQDVAMGIYEVVEGMNKTPNTTPKRPIKISKPIQKTNSPMSTNTQQIRQLLQNDRLDDAIRQLLQLVQQVGDNQLSTTATLLSARNNSNKRGQTLGTLSVEHFRMEKARIIVAVQSVLNELDRDYPNSFKD